MFFDNLEVNHKSFGKGIVISQQGKYITVQFSTAKKVFVYPDAFETFLTLADGTVPNTIAVDIENSRRARQAIIDKKKEENIRAMTKGIVIPGKVGAMNDADEDENQYKAQENE